MRRDESGYTIVELVTVLGILMVAIIAVSGFLYTSLNQSSRTQARIDAVEQSRAALRQMSRELRQASYIIDDSLKDRGSGKQQIAFAVDFNGSGTISDCDSPTSTPECVVYTYQGGELFRHLKKKGASGALIANGVTAFSIDYFGNDPVCDTNGDGIVTETEIDSQCPSVANGKIDGAEFDKVTRVLVTVTVTQRGQSQTFSADITLRNQNDLVNPL